jgi:PBSX family phage terminase large subunit
MSGKTKHTIRRNVLEDLFMFVGSDNYSFNSTDGVIDMLGRRIYVVGANDERSEEKIRGMTIAGWYDDETTLKPESFFKQAIARMSVENSKAFLTTNPDSPYHWLLTEYIENPELAGILKRFRFSFDDNNALSREYKESLKKLYSGLWYKRMILGLWVLADGAIYDMFDEKRHVSADIPDDLLMDMIGIDFGTSNPTAFIPIGKKGNVFYIPREYYYDARKAQRQKTVAKYSADFKEFRGKLPATPYADPSATALFAQFEEDGIYVERADNDVLAGIQTVSTLLEQGRIIIHPDCKNLIREFNSYIWDAKAQKKRGEDKPVKENDHALDALRYALHTSIGQTLHWSNERPAGW